MEAELENAIEKEVFPVSRDQVIVKFKKYSAPMIEFTAECLYTRIGDSIQISRFVLNGTEFPSGGGSLDGMVTTYVEKLASKNNIGGGERAVAKEK